MTAVMTQRNPNSAAATGGTPAAAGAKALEMIGVDDAW
jgi:hypothetical protein